MSDIRLVRETDYWHGYFKAMASPCEVLMEIDEQVQAQVLFDAVMKEALRIEQKFSRYRNDNIIYRINTAQGREIAVDDETARLIDFAEQLYRMSDGRFDITSGVLRRAWKFDGSDNLPSPEKVSSLLEYVGWQKVKWTDGKLKMPAGMEIDIGGLGKEYAVDRCVQLARELTSESVLINFGGDLATTCQRRDDKCWAVGRLVTGKDNAVALFQLKHGAIATSGDAHRYLLKEDVRYSHVLDPTTGWPVPEAPHTVSVAAPTCIEAGMLSTLAMLHGAQAEAFLKLQQVDFWLD